MPYIFYLPEFMDQIDQALLDHPDNIKAARSQLFAKLPRVEIFKGDGAYIDLWR